MFTLLPESVKNQVLELLAQNNFVAAKALCDAWLKQQAEQELNSISV